MRPPPQSSLHRIAVVSTSFRSSTAAYMSTRPPFRGGRGFRGRGLVARDARIVFEPLGIAVNYNDFNNRYNAQGYSYETYPSNVSGNRNSAQNYSYDNQQMIGNGFRRGGYNNISSNQYNAQNYSYENQRHFRNDFRSGSSNNNRGAGNFGPIAAPPGNFGPRAASPTYNQLTNQPAGAFHRQKPADFRTWEFAKNPPPGNSERFILVSYNILADYLAGGHRMLYFHIPRRFMSWEWRKNNILFELKLWSPDIICLQEVDKFQELEEDLRVRGYSGIWKMCTGQPVDGCAVFFRTTRFKLMFEDCIEFNKHGMRDNIAQICVLESLTQNQDGNQLSSSSSDGPNRVVVCNIHVLFNPKRGEMKLGQVRMLLEKAQAVSKIWDDAPIVLCGDFNCTPKSPMYNFISQQKLDISQVKRDQISGQASAEIRPPARLYSNNFRGQPAGRMANPTTTPNNVLENKTRGNGDLNEHQSDNACSSSPESAQVRVIDPTSDLPSQPVNDLNTSSASNHDKTDEKSTGLSENEIDKSLEENTNVGEGTEEFLSALHSGEDVSPPNMGDVALESHIAVGYTPYDPSKWTAAEIATATGNTDITTLEHPLKLRSTYTEVVDSSGTRDSCGEPLVTSYNSHFMGTVDYIWRSEGLQTIKVLAPIPKDVMQPSRGFPTKKWGSDHIALAAELAFSK